MTHSDIETMEAGVSCAHFLSAGTCLSLNGDLGAGKTVFTKGLAAGLGVRSTDDVHSPTFTLINEYGNDKGLVLVHMDFYRLDMPEDIARLGLEEYFLRDCICVIEWGGKFDDLLPPDRLRAEIHITNETTREITLWNSLS